MQAGARETGAPCLSRPTRQLFGGNVYGERSPPMFPMCYVGAAPRVWRQVLQPTLALAQLDVAAPAPTQAALSIDAAQRNLPLADGLLRVSGGRARRLFSFQPARTADRLRQTAIRKVTRPSQARRAAATQRSARRQRLEHGGQGRVAAVVL